MFLLIIIIHILSQFEFCSFVTIWVLEFCHHLRYWVLSQFELSHFKLLIFFFFTIWAVTIWVLSQLKVCHNLSFITIWVLSQLEFCHSLSFVIFWFFEFCHKGSFSFITIWVVKFCLNLSLWVSSQFVLLSWITIWVFKFHHVLSFLFISSQFDYLSLLVKLILLYKKGTFFKEIFQPVKTIKLPTTEFFLHKNQKLQETIG